jgi:hypothetical protein
MPAGLPAPLWEFNATPPGVGAARTDRSPGQPTPESGRPVPATRAPATPALANLAPANPAPANPAPADPVPRTQRGGRPGWGQPRPRPVAIIRHVTSSARRDPPRPSLPTGRPALTSPRPRLPSQPRSPPARTGHRARPRPPARPRLSAAQPPTTPSHGDGTVAVYNVRPHHDPRASGDSHRPGRADGSQLLATCGQQIAARTAGEP